MRGYPMLGLSVANHDELLCWADHLTAFDIEHSDRNMRGTPRLPHQSRRETMWLFARLSATARTM
jgi:hypothetical protein